MHARGAATGSSQPPAKRLKPTRSRASESATPAVQHPRARSPAGLAALTGLRGQQQAEQAFARAGTPNSVYAQGNAALLRRANSPQGSQVTPAVL